MAPPNVVVYIAHDMGRFASPYGVETVNSPNLERLAREGAVFDNHFCTAPQCSPARAGLFTGRHPHSTGVLGLTGGWAEWTLNEDEQHLARLLGREGYESAIIGIAHEAAASKEQLAVCGFDDTTYHNMGEDAAVAGDQLAEWLDRRDNPEKPFFAEIGTLEVHHPFVFHGIEPDDSKGVTVQPPLEDGTGTKDFFAALQGCVKHWDDGLGKVLDTLENRGMLDDTLVIVTTDHGIPAPRAKCTLYDRGLESILFMRYPRVIPAGSRYDTLLSHVDIVPTVLDAVGGHKPANLHGQSFWHLLQGKNYEPRDAIYGEKTYHTEYDPMRGIRTDRYKYVRNFEGVTHEHCCRDCMDGGIYKENLHLRSVERQSMAQVAELYDLQNDPMELNNLAEDPEYAAVRKDLEKRLVHHMQETQDPILEGPVAAPFFYDKLEELKAQATEK